jgi:hypothetical protein
LIVQVAFAFALSEIDPVVPVISALYLNELFNARVGSVHDEVAACEIGTKATSVVNRNSMHPAFCGDGGFGYPTVGYVFPERCCGGFHQ